MSGGQGGSSQNGTGGGSSNRRGTTPPVFFEPCSEGGNAELVFAAFLQLTWALKSAALAALTALAALAAAASCGEPQMTKSSRWRFVGSSGNTVWVVACAVLVVLDGCNSLNPFRQRFVFVITPNRKLRTTPLNFCQNILNSDRKQMRTSYNLLEAQTPTRLPPTTSPDFFPSET